MKKRFLAILCAFLLCLGILPALAAGVEQQVIQLVINDHFFDKELNTATMPVSIGGVIYAPYTVFDKNVAGADFRIFCNLFQDGGEYTLTLYSLYGRLRFDLLRGTASDAQGEAVNMQATLRNGRPFLPIQAVCTYFNNLAGYTVVQYVYTETDYGVLIRLRNSDAVLKDSAFRSSALSAMRTRYTQYLQKLSPSPTPVATVPPAAPSTPLPQPSPSAPSEPETSERPETPVYLAVRCGVGGGLNQILSTLSASRISALLLFAPEDLEEQADEVRRAVGLGHSIGLAVPGGSAEEVQQALAEGNKLLERIAWTRAHIALPSGSNPELQHYLEQQGWRCWTGTEIAADSSSSSRLVSRIYAAVEQQEGTAWITLDDSFLSASTLPRLLARFQEERYVVRQPLETEF